VGAEIAVHLVRSVVEAHGDDDSFALRTFDFTNAFNEVSRQKILDIVHEKYPELYPYVKMCSAKSSHLWWDGHRMMPEWGIQRGYPLGPFLFCLVIHPVLTEVAKQVVAEFPDLTEEGVFRLFIFYLDDDYVVAKHAVLIRLGELTEPHGMSWMTFPHPTLPRPRIPLLPRRFSLTRSLAVFHVIYTTWRTTPGRTSTWLSRRLGRPLRPPLAYSRSTKTLGFRFSGRKGYLC
jgi:hypothetical protein